MLRCLPEVGKQSCFAVKGGTAINLFLRPMPRLSVDIDLTYLPLSARDEALRGLGPRCGRLGKTSSGTFRIRAPRSATHRAR